MSEPVSIDRLREIKAAARQWIERGFRPVRIPHGSKSPKGKEFIGWGKRDWLPDDFKSDDNIGLQDGPCAAGNLITIDCDCAEAVALAPHFLPATELIGGRAARGPAHYRYLGDVPLSARRIQFGSKEEGHKTLVEFRSSELEGDRPAKAHQTVIPPSLHFPSGEPYVWYSEGDPASVSSKDLLRAVNAVAAGCVIAQYFPSKGRHDFAMALGATLLRSGWSVEQAHDFILRVWEVGGSEDAKTRADTVYHSAEIISKGGRCTGLPRIREIVGDKATDKLVEWLDVKGQSSHVGEAINNISKALSPTAIGIELPPRFLRSRSYLSAVTIIQDNVADILDGRKLEMNEMLGCATLGRKTLLDTDVTRIRSEIERRVSAGTDANGDPLGLTLSLNDVHGAVLQVAQDHAYHPVREYLRSLEWDNVERLGDVPAMLGVADTPLNRAIVRRWFISAVARPLSPGCKVDTMLVLVGGQGKLKSTVFRVLAGDGWFSDSAVDVHHKDAFLTLRRSWVLEWAELESLRRARDAGAVKSFLTSGTDTYRPSYGRLDVRVPRTGVIVGSTNDPEFLADETGNRRYWPLSVTSSIDIDGLRAARDQLWAEAVCWYTVGEPWWLSLDEEEALAPVHEAHAVHDAWEAPILTWMENPLVSHIGEAFVHGQVPPAGTKTAERTTANILTHVLKLDIGRWGRAEENRVGRILRRNGWSTFKPHGRPRIWQKL